MGVAPEKSSATSLRCFAHLAGSSSELSCLLCRVKLLGREHVLLLLAAAVGLCLIAPRPKGGPVNPWVFCGPVPSVIGFSKNRVLRWGGGVKGGDIEANGHGLGMDFHLAFRV